MWVWCGCGLTNEEAGGVVSGLIGWFRGEGEGVSVFGGGVLGV